MLTVWFNFIYRIIEKSPWGKPGSFCRWSCHAAVQMKYPVWTTSPGRKQYLPITGSLSIENHWEKTRLHHRYKAESHMTSILKVVWCGIGYGNNEHLPCLSGTGSISYSCLPGSYSSFWMRWSLSSSKYVHVLAAILVSKNQERDRQDSAWCAYLLLWMTGYKLHQYPGDYFFQPGPGS